MPVERWIPGSSPGMTRKIKAPEGDLHGRRRTFCTVPCDPRCSSIFCEGHKGTVILGLDPRIHKETGRVLVVGWIAGSKSGNDKKTNSPKENKK